jgi:hypothetical protein
MDPFGSFDAVDELVSSKLEDAGEPLSRRVACSVWR